MTHWRPYLSRPPPGSNAKLGHYPFLQDVDINMLLCEDGHMRTTVDLPDATFREIKALAARKGLTLKELLLRGVQDQISKGRSERRKHVVKLPLIPASRTGTIPSMTNADIEDLLD
jgi:hypothetical protein